jgi:hypothetical protein
MVFLSFKNLKITFAPIKEVFAMEMVGTKVSIAFYRNLGQQIREIATTR